MVSSTGHGKKTLNHVHYQEGKFALGTILEAVIPKDDNILSAQFLYLYLSHLKDLLLVPLMRGAANVSLPIKAIKSVEIPLPEINTQRKIVTKFNGIDFVRSDLLDEIARRQIILKKFRQSILQEAVQGKLTKEWRRENPEIEPASKL
ncbi:MAG: restriction endonuclease subunit S, partial [Desulfobulbaceae bacterium]|nr:restriction endonuclease subunit S [Desulfobulbaceae bacterium]